jgi:alcohol dehydrogenase
MYEQGLAAPYALTNPFHTETVYLAPPEEGEVLVEVSCAGIGHSDLAHVSGLRRRAVPVVGGHEGAGIVREVCGNVGHLKRGDHVVMTVAAGCGSCRPCASGQPALCLLTGVAREKGVLANGKSRLFLGDRPVHHYSGISSFAEFAVCSARSLVKIDPQVPMQVAAILGCTVLSGAGSLFNAARLKPGQSVAVLGLGGVGLSAAIAAKDAGAGMIIGLDVNADRFPLARDLGCSNVFDPAEPGVVEQIMALTNGGTDFVIEASGAASAVRLGGDIVARGGEVICIGLGSTSEMLEYARAEFVLQGKSLRSSFMGNADAQRDIALYARLYLEGRMPLDRLISGEITFSELNQGLDLLAEGKVVRQVVNPQERKRRGLMNGH